jgi:hypothetical protein
MWTAHARSYQRRLHDRNLQYNDAVARIAELHKEQIKADGEYCAIDEERVREMRSADEQSQINIDLRHQLNQLVNYTNAAAHAVRDMMWIAFVWNNDDFKLGHILNKARSRAELMGISDIGEANKWVSAYCAKSTPATSMTMTCWKPGNT